MDRSRSVAGIELGLHDDVTMREVHTLLTAARNHCDLPVIVRLPLYHALELSEVAQNSGAEGIVIAAPPRGTARDPQAERLIGGRLYGSWIKPQVLRVIGRVVQYADVPIIACGGIHTPDDARDYLIAGARAVQLDSIVWINPKMAQTIAETLGGGSDLTRTSITSAEEWEPGMPPDLPELPPDPSDITSESNSDIPWVD